MSDEDLEVSQADVESLAEKLEALAPSLTENEREILSWVMRKAAAGEDAEVVGFAMGFGSPLASTLGQAISLKGPTTKLKGVGPSGFPNINPGTIRAKTSNAPGYQG